MDVDAPLPADAQAAELVQPTDRPLDRPTPHPKPAAVRRAAAGDVRADRAARQRQPVAVVVVPAVGDYAPRLPQRRPRLPRTGGIALTSGISCVLSWRLAPVTVAASGTPSAVTTT